jgi:iron complex transport system ATP-binding protein
MRSTSADQAGSNGVVLTLEGVEFGYEPSRPVIRGVGGSLHVGRLVALIGPNAAGKSTLLRLMLGQLRPGAGHVRLEGREVTAMPPRDRAVRVSYVPQQGALGFAFTVREVVSMGRFAAGRDVDAVDHALEQCDLAPLRDRVFAHLSAGQQQRVMLARAIAQAGGRGRLMLLDEPGSHMDLWHVHAMMRLLVGLTGAGMAVLVVLHDLNLAARYADEVWLLHEGLVVEAGTWDRVMQPARLEPVYRVRLRAVNGAAGDRPVLVVDSTLPR